MYQVVISIDYRAEITEIRTIDFFFILVNMRFENQAVGDKYQPSQLEDVI